MVIPSVFEYETNLWSQIKFVSEQSSKKPHLYGSKSKASTKSTAAKRKSKGGDEFFTANTKVSNINS